VTGVSRKRETSPNFMLCDIDINRNEKEYSTNTNGKTKMFSQKNSNSYTIPKPNGDFKNSQDSYLPIPKTLFTLSSILLVVLSIVLEIGFIYCLRYYGIFNIYTGLVCWGLTTITFILWDMLWVWCTGVLGFSFPVMIIFFILAINIA